MKKVLILRGLPGSGKSSFARTRTGAVVVSADDFFTVDGVYAFNPAKIGEAHKACWSNFLRAAQDGVAEIIVDNTNLGVAEIAAYWLPAEVMGYTPIILQFNCTVYEATGRNTHGVPEEIIARMAAAMDAEKLPPCSCRRIPWWCDHQASRSKYYLSSPYLFLCGKFFWNVEQVRHRSN